MRKILTNKNDCTFELVEYVGGGIFENLWRTHGQGNNIFKSQNFISSMNDMINVGKSHTEECVYEWNETIYVLEFKIHHSRCFIPNFVWLHKSKIIFYRNVTEKAIT